MTRLLTRAAPPLAALMLATCGPTPDDRAAGRDAAVPSPRIAEAPDPAVAAALAAPIMVDPALTRSANAHSIRPPDLPRDGAVPPDAARFASPR